MRKLYSLPNIDVSAKQVYEWIVTNKYSKYNFVDWLNEKKLLKQAESPFYTSNGILIHRPNSSLVYEWIATRFWDFKQFQKWMNNNLDLDMR